MIKCNDITIRRCLGKRWGKAPEGGGWRCVPHERGWCPLSGEGWRHTCHPYACCCWCPNLHWFPMEKSIIFVRGALALPPPLKNVAGPENFPLMFLTTACAIKTIFQGGNWLNCMIYSERKWPRLKYTVRAVHLPLLIRLISTVVCISAQGAPSAKIFFDLFIWCLKELWHRISDS